MRGLGCRVPYPARGQAGHSCSPADRIHRRDVAAQFARVSSMSPRISVRTASTLARRDRGLSPAPYTCHLCDRYLREAGEPRRVYSGQRGPCSTEVDSAFFLCTCLVAHAAWSRSLVARMRTVPLDALHPTGRLSWNWPLRCRRHQVAIPISVAAFHRATDNQPVRVYFRDNPAAVGNIRRGPARRCPRVGVAVERVRVEHRPLMRRAREGHSLCHCTLTRRAASLCRTGAPGSDTRSRGRCFHRPPGIPTRQRVAQVGRRHARGQHGNGQSRQNVTKGTNTKANTAAIRASFHGAAPYRIPQAPRARHSTQVEPVEPGGNMM